jgi:hypothetical protein
MQAQSRGTQREGASHFRAGSGRAVVAQATSLGAVPRATRPRGPWSDDRRPRRLGSTESRPTPSRPDGRKSEMRPQRDIPVSVLPESAGEKFLCRRGPPASGGEAGEAPFARRTDACSAGPRRKGPPPWRRWVTLLGGFPQGGGQPGRPRPAKRCKITSGTSICWDSKPPGGGAKRWRGTGGHRTTSPRWPRCPQRKARSSLPPIHWGGGSATPGRPCAGPRRGAWPPLATNAGRAPSTAGSTGGRTGHRCPKNAWLSDVAGGSRPLGRGRSRSGSAISGRVPRWRKAGPSSPAGTGEPPGSPGAQQPGGPELQRAPGQRPDRLHAPAHPGRAGGGEQPPRGSGEAGLRLS